jgi:hypothetical protein
MGKLVLPIFIASMASGPHKRDTIRHYKKLLNKEVKNNGKRTKS